MNDQNQKNTATVQLLEKYPEHLVWYVRQAIGLEEDDTSRDECILRMSRANFLDKVATWNGLIHYGDTIREWVGDVYNVELGENDVTLAAPAQVLPSGSGFTMEVRVEAFLKELAELTKKHGIALYGCGCCAPLIDIVDGKGKDVGGFGLLEYRDGEYDYS